MILSFSKERFVHMIESGEKIHTLRNDPKKRWYEGMGIQYWKGSPRQIHQGSYKFREGECAGVQEMELHLGSLHNRKYSYAIIDGWVHGHEALEQLAINDGLPGIRGLIKWFGYGVHYLRIIHWTDKRY